MMLYYVCIVWWESKNITRFPARQVSAEITAGSEVSTINRKVPRVGPGSARPQNGGTSLANLGTRKHGKHGKHGKLKNCYPKNLMKTAFCYIFFIFPFEICRFRRCHIYLGQTHMVPVCPDPCKSESALPAKSTHLKCFPTQHALPLNMYLQTERSLCDFRRLHKQKNVLLTKAAV